jgi:hypothetical protein
VVRSSTELQISRLACIEDGNGNRLDVVLASTSCVGTDHERVVVIFSRRLRHCVEGDESKTFWRDSEAGRLRQVIAWSAIVA